MGELWCRRRLSELLLISTLTSFHHANAFFWPKSHYWARKTPGLTHISPPLYAIRPQSKPHRSQYLVTSRLAATANRTEDDDVELSQQFLQRNQHWVVLVDDELSIRQSVGDYLYDAGYQVTACADADALLDLLEHGNIGMPVINGTTTIMTPNGSGSVATLDKLPAAIISDIRMPGKDGLELVRILRQNSRWKRIPIIMLTAKGLTPDRIAGYQAGADYYLPKPFNPDELLSILDSGITRKTQMSGAAGALLDLQHDLESVKHVLRRNGRGVVKRTDVYLTPVERQVLDLVAQGYTNAEIAQQRSVAVDRIVKIMQQLFGKTNCKSRTELLRWAIDTGYVSVR